MIISASSAASKPTFTTSSINQLGKKLVDLLMAASCMNEINSGIQIKWHTG
jgi:hypothetical protein